MPVGSVGSSRLHKLRPSIQARKVTPMHIVGSSGFKKYAHTHRQFIKAPKITPHTTPMHQRSTIYAHARRRFNKVAAITPKHIVGSSTLQHNHVHQLCFVVQLFINFKMFVFCWCSCLFYKWVFWICFGVCKKKPMYLWMRELH